MTLTNEDLLALSDILDTRLAPIKSNIRSMQNDIQKIKSFQEGTLLPKLNADIASYSDTYNHYKDNVDRMEAAFSDISLLKKVVNEHTQKLQDIS